MDRLIREITEQLFSRLPETEEYFRLHDLEEYGFPSFIIRRIHIELTWNLDESMILPETDWAHTGSDSVREAWQQFLKAIHDEVQLPAGYAQAVIETAVSDVVEILVQPRKNIPEILFGGEELLSEQELAERTDLLVVYPHFARVLTSYMDRKNRSELDRNQCKEIVSRVDARITKKYTPLQWAQMVDPLFTLAGNSVDTNIFRLFFEDKNRLGVARQFDLIGDKISRAAFIEVLSSPDLLNTEGSGPNHPEHVVEKNKPEQIDTADDITEDEMSEEIPQEQEIEVQSPKLNEEQVAGPQKISEKVEKNKDEKTTTGLKSETPKDPEEDVELSEWTRSIEQTTGAFENEEEQAEEPHSLNQIFSDEEDAGLSGDKIFREESAHSEDDSERPIWMRFSEQDDGKKQQSQPDEEQVNAIDEPVSTPADNPRPITEKENLERLLEDEKNYYIKELFNGSERAYKKALHKIAMEKDWKWASQLIRKNIFERHSVDIYSEPAVDFTDRLHTYFSEKQNTN